jgi:hypothetical protein
MIKLNYSYTILFASTVAGVGTAADSTPTAVLWRNGSASGVSVTVSTTAQTGLYKAVFTTDSGWAAADYLELYVTATIAGTAGYLAKVWSSTEIGAVELDSASRLAIWNTLTTGTFTADSFGELLIISDGTNGREVKVTASGHIAADIHDVQPDGLSGSTEIINIENASGYLLAVLAGACADPQTASETYAITVFGSTFTVDMAGQTGTGTRTAPTLTKT